MLFSYTLFTFKKSLIGSQMLAPRPVLQQYNKVYGSFYNDNIMYYAVAKRILRKGSVAYPVPQIQYVVY